MSISINDGEGTIMTSAEQDWAKNQIPEHRSLRKIPMQMLDETASQNMVHCLAALEIITDLRLTKSTVDLQKTAAGQKYPELYLLLHADKIRSLNTRVMSTLKHLCFNEEVSIDDIADGFLSSLCIDEENIPQTYRDMLVEFLTDMVDDYQENSADINTNETLFFLTLTANFLFDTALKYSNENVYLCPIEQAMVTTTTKYLARSICKKLKTEPAEAVLQSCMEPQETLPRLQNIFDTLQTGIEHMAAFCATVYNQTDQFNPTHKNLRHDVEFFMVIISDIHQEVCAMKSRGLLTVSTEELSNHIVCALAETDEIHKEDFTPPVLDDHHVILGFINNFIRDELESQPDIHIDPTTQNLQNQACMQMIAFYDHAKSTQNPTKPLTP